MICNIAILENGQYLQRMKVLTQIDYIDSSASYIIPYSICLRGVFVLQSDLSNYTTLYRERNTLLAVLTTRIERFNHIKQTSQTAVQAKKSILACQTRLQHRPSLSREQSELHHSKLTAQPHQRRTF
jgi:hypothetical protein